MPNFGLPGAGRAPASAIGKIPGMRKAPVTAQGLLSAAQKGTLAPKLGSEGDFYPGYPVQTAQEQQIYMNSPQGDIQKSRLRGAQIGGALGLGLGGLWAWDAATGQPGAVTKKIREVIRPGSKIPGLALRVGIGGLAGAIGGGFLGGILARPKTAAKKESTMRYAWVKTASSAEGALVDGGMASAFEQVLADMHVDPNLTHCSPLVRAKIASLRKTAIMSPGLAMAKRLASNPPVGMIVHGPMRGGVGTLEKVRTVVSPEHRGGFATSRALPHRLDRAMARHPGITPKPLG